MSGCVVKAGKLKKNELLFLSKSSNPFVNCCINANHRLDFVMDL